MVLPFLVLLYSKAYEVTLFALWEGIRHVITYQEYSPGASVLCLTC